MFYCWWAIIGVLAALGGFLWSRWRRYKREKEYWECMTPEQQDVALELLLESIAEDYRKRLDEINR